MTEPTRCKPNTAPEHSCRAWVYTKLIYLHGRWEYLKHVRSNIDGIHSTQTVHVDHWGKNKAFKWTDYTDWIIEWLHEQLGLLEPSNNYAPTFSSVFDRHAIRKGPRWDKMLFILTHVPIQIHILYILKKKKQLYGHWLEPIFTSVSLSPLYALIIFSPRKPIVF